MNLNCTNCKQEIDVSAIPPGAGAVCPLCNHEITVAVHAATAPPTPPADVVKSQRRVSPLDELPKGGPALQIIMASSAAFIFLGPANQSTPLTFSAAVMAIAFLVAAVQIVNRLDRILREMVLARIDREKSAK